MRLCSRFTLLRIGHGEVGGVDLGEAGREVLGPCGRGVLGRNRDLRRRLHGGVDEEGVAWADVCGVNAIGTVIFLKAVPAHCLRARGRDWANGLAGTALEMEEMWRL